ncbi:hypothetical protein P8452_25852 [Trifolium repens]|nr:hypothetical protein P8452_25852 [Trifolium repens]
MNTINTLLLSQNHPIGEAFLLDLIAVEDEDHKQTHGDKTKTQSPTCSSCPDSDAIPARCFYFRCVFLPVQSSVLHETTTFAIFVKRRTSSSASPQLPPHLRRLRSSSPENS